MTTWWLQIYSLFLLDQIHGQQAQVTVMRGSQRGHEENIEVMMRSFNMQLAGGGKNGFCLDVFKDWRDVLRIKPDEVGLDMSRGGAVNILLDAEFRTATGSIWIRQAKLGRWSDGRSMTLQLKASDWCSLWYSRCLAAWWAMM